MFALIWTLFDLILILLISSGPFWDYLLPFELIWTFLNYLGPFWTSLNLSELLWTFSNFFEPFWTFCIFKPFWTFKTWIYLNLFWIYLDLSETLYSLFEPPFWTYLNVLWTSFDLLVYFKSQWTQSTFWRSLERQNQKKNLDQFWASFFMSLQVLYVAKYKLKFYWAINWDSR